MAHKNNNITCKSMFQIFVQETTSILSFIYCNLNFTFDTGVRKGEVRLYFLCFKIIIDYYFESPDEQTIFI